MNIYNCLGEPGRRDIADMEKLAKALKICQAPVLTNAHRVIGTAAILGFLFTATHTVTLVVTSLTSGWPIGPLMLDLMGFFAGFVFAFICKESSNTSSELYRKKNLYILFFSLATAGSRILDTLMLLGIVRWGDVYETPSGAVFYSNLISEIIFGNCYTITAFIGSIMLLKFPQDQALQTDEDITVNYEAPLLVDESIESL